MFIGWGTDVGPRTMRVLHTADLHLRSDTPQSLEALDTILDTAERQDVDVLTIGGDMFDGPEHANELRPELRSKFRDTSFEILVIPGNHDAEVFERDLEFGHRIEPLVDSPCHEHTVGAWDIVGVPYTPSFSEELYQSLKDSGNDGRDSILLLHCTLDIGFGAVDVGAESSVDYCPVKQSTLAELGFEYVLAGHIHSRHQRRPLTDGGVFVYPGSPVSHSTSETGRRVACLVDTERPGLDFVPLDTFYHDRNRWTVRPGTENEVIAEIEEWVSERSSDDCELEVVVEGFTESEAGFADALDEAVGDVTVEEDYRGVDAVIEHPLYERFERRLADREDVLDGEEVLDLFITALDSLQRQGVIRR